MDPRGVRIGIEVEFCTSPYPWRKVTMIRREIYVRRIESMDGWEEEEEVEDEEEHIEESHLEYELSIPSWEARTDGSLSTREGGVEFVLGGTSDLEGAVFSLEELFQEIDTEEFILGAKEGAGMHVHISVDRAFRHLVSSEEAELVGEALEVPEWQNLLLHLQKKKAYWSRDNYCEFDFSPDLGDKYCAVALRREHDIEFRLWRSPASLLQAKANLYLTYLLFSAWMDSEFRPREGERPTHLLARAILDTRRIPLELREKIARTLEEAVEEEDVLEEVATCVLSPWVGRAGKMALRLLRMKKLVRAA